MSIVLGLNYCWSSVLAEQFYKKPTDVKTYGIRGADEGELISLCEDSIQVKAPKGSDAGLAEDVHMMRAHMVTKYLEHELV